MSFDINTYVPSYSFLKSLNEQDGAPNKALHRKLSVRKETDAQRWGKALDVALLQPDKFSKQFRMFDKVPDKETKKYKFTELFMYAIGRGASRKGAVKFGKKFSGIRNKIEYLEDATKEGGAFWPEIEYIFNANLYTPLTPHEWDSALWAAESARTYEPFEPYLSDPALIIQPKLEWTNPVTGIKCKGELDLGVKDSWIGDIKTAKTAAPKRFARRYGELQSFGYGEQLAAYSEAWGHHFEEHDHFLFVIEKTEPYACSLIKVSWNDMFYFRENWYKWCAYFKHIKENDLWHLGYEYFNDYEAEIMHDPDGPGFIAKVESKDFTGIYETDIFN